MQGEGLEGWNGDRISHPANKKSPLINAVESRQTTSHPPLHRECCQHGQAGILGSTRLFPSPQRSVLLANHESRSTVSSPTIQICLPGCLAQCWGSVATLRGPCTVVQVASCPEAQDRNPPSLNSSPEPCMGYLESRGRASHWVSRNVW